MTDLFGGIYKGKKVFVTGHTGFKGTWLSLWLERLGARVCGYALAPPTKPSHIDLIELDMESHIENIKDAEKLSEIMRGFQPDIVFHLAAQPLVRYSYENPYETYETNVMGTLNVCEAVRSCQSVSALVAVTTDKVYENKEWLWGYREIDRLGGYDPYSSSKACAEILLSSYRNSFFNIADYGKKHNVLMSSVRAGNVIGGGDWSKDRLVPDIMKATADNIATVIRSPRAVRPWQHVLDCLSGYLCNGRMLLEGEKSAAAAYNFGPAESDLLPVKTVCGYVSAVWPSARFRFPDSSDEPHEAGLLRLDCSKSRENMSWKPLWDSENAIRRTVEWYRGYYENGSVRSESDLEQYVSHALEKEAVWAKQY